MNKQDLLKGFSDEDERLVFAKVLDQAEFCMKRRSPAFSVFMDRAKCARFLERMKNFRDVEVIAFGGMEDCERMMLGFFPMNYEGERTFPIQTLRIQKKSKKFGQTDLSHRDYLGSILGLGIDRSKVGDIVLLEDDAFCFAYDDIAGYICTCLEQVSKTNVVVEEIDAAVLAIKKNTQTKRMTVASMRLDAVAGEVFHLSRGKIQQLIKGEKVQLNWTSTTNTSCTVKSGDMVSVRGYGRFSIGEELGKTKKDRVSLEVELYI